MFSDERGTLVQGLGLSDLGYPGENATFTGGLLAVHDLQYRKNLEAMVFQKFSLAELKSYLKFKVRSGIGV